jgi:hypothetical protein
MNEEIKLEFKVFQQWWKKKAKDQMVSLLNFATLLQKN